MMLEPAVSIIARCGGVTTVTRVCGVHSSAPYKWRWPRSMGGTGGTIPQRHHAALLDWAKRNCVPLTAADFLPRTTTATADTDLPEVVSAHA